jgi:chromosome segregation ATPase
MDISIDTLLSIATLFMGGGCGAFFTWRYQRRKAKAEAIDSEATATEKVQDVYQQLITDIKADRDEQKAYIQELKDDRRHLRQENADLRNRVDSTDEDVRQLKKEVARTGRMVEFMRPFLCGKTKCQDRVNVTIQDDGEVKQSKKPKGDNYNKQE